MHDIAAEVHISVCGVETKSSIIAYIFAVCSNSWHLIIGAYAKLCDEFLRLYRTEQGLVSLINHLVWWWNMVANRKQTTQDGVGRLHWEVLPTPFTAPILAPSDFRFVWTVEWTPGSGGKGALRHKCSTTARCLAVVTTAFTFLILQRNRETTTMMVTVRGCTGSILQEADLVWYRNVLL